ncbi:MAG: nuclear transport factor 2 family protein [Rugosibacter sp.]
MIIKNALFITLFTLIAFPVNAAWQAANPVAAEAVKNPRIAAVLAVAMRFDQAILAHDEVVFSDTFTDDAVVNNPFNKIARKADAVKNLRIKLIDYATLDRSIEYAAIRGSHDVVLMGEETLTPVGQARFAGKQVRRRTTEVWTDESGQWKLAIRQATIYVAE